MVYTESPILTTYELLGEFIVLDEYSIDELKENRKTAHAFISAGHSKTIEIDKMLGQKVILICDELIEELCTVVNSLNL